MHIANGYITLFIDNTQWMANSLHTRAYACLWSFKKKLSYPCISSKLEIRDDGGKKTLKYMKRILFQWSWARRFFWTRSPRHFHPHLSTQSNKVITKSIYNWYVLNWWKKKNPNKPQKKRQAGHSLPARLSRLFSLSPIAGQYVLVDVIASPWSI